MVKMGSHRGGDHMDGGGSARDDPGRWWRIAVVRAMGRRIERDRGSTVENIEK